ncbi:hypothetical protein Y1Q_0016431 [Alligator mississippiensis]|uniref:Uncharacterized protein n=1 Tax=Alligator mississippiensis TaxID=8496 RepID=A0A151N2L6_ALLMI|nr:hypothetical protein Y1Q_0016431 [Alligator mississippiensis]
MDRAGRGEEKRVFSGIRSVRRSRVQSTRGKASGGRLESGVRARSRWAWMWSCAQVVSCLLDPSADKEVPTAEGEQAVQLTSKKETGRIMGELVLQSKWKIRKLPDTLVRKDKDVARLQDFQELELVLVP